MRWVAKENLLDMSLNISSAQIWDVLFSAQTTSDFLHVLVTVKFIVVVLTKIKRETFPVIWNQSLLFVQILNDKNVIFWHVKSTYWKVSVEVLILSVIKLSSKRTISKNCNVK